MFPASRRFVVPVHISVLIFLPAICPLHLWSNFISSPLLLLNLCSTPTLVSEPPRRSRHGGQCFQPHWTHKSFSPLVQLGLYFIVAWTSSCDFASAGQRLNQKKKAQNDEGMKPFCHHWSRIWVCDKRFLHHFWLAHSGNSSFFFFRLVLFTGCCLNIHSHPQTSYGNIRLYKVHLNSPWSFCASTAPRVTAKHRKYSQNHSGTNI